MRGVIKRVRYSHGRREYALTDGKSDYSFQSEDNIPQGSFVEIQGEVDGNRIVPTLIIILEGKEAEEAQEKIKVNMKEQIGEGPSIVQDDVTKGLWPMLGEAALEIIAAKRTGRFVLLRFHGDADGICGAFAISGMVRCKAFQQNSAVYTVKDAFRDIGAVGQEANPLIILLDFASNDASKEGIELLKAAHIQHMVIDHHPFGESPPEGVINPFTLTSDGSRYSAGYLACEIAISCGMDREEARGLAGIACSGDKSDLLPHDEKDAEKARVLDFLAAHVSFGNNLDFYKKVMEKDELFTSIARQAQESIENAAAKVKVKQMKEGELSIVTFTLDNIVKKGEWPPAGKITTKIFEDMKDRGPLVVIGYNERSLIIRLNEGAERLGANANGLAKEMCDTMPGLIYGGGGHTRAGAIRVKEGFARDVLGRLVERIKEKIKNIS